MVEEKDYDRVSDTLLDAFDAVMLAITPRTSIGSAEYQSMCMMAAAECMLMAELFTQFAAGTRVPKIREKT